MFAMLRFDFIIDWIHFGRSLGCSSVYIYCMLLCTQELHIVLSTLWMMGFKILLSFFFFQIKTGNTDN